MGADRGGVVSLSQATVIGQVRAIIAEALEAAGGRAYGADDGGEDAIPPALHEFPAALVLPGETREYVLMTGGQRHTYAVKILVLQGGMGGDVGQAAYAALPLVDTLIARFEGNVTLGNRANSAIFERSSGFVTLTYAEIDYLGYEVTLRVSEQATAAPAVGD